MASIDDGKRLSDEELDNISGGVTAPTIDPSAMAALMHSTVSAAVAGGGAYTVDTHTPAAHTDTGTPTITGQTQTTVSGSTIFGGGTSTAPESLHVVTEPAPVVSGTITLSGNLNMHIPTQPSAPEMTVMHFDSSQGTFHKIVPVVVGVQEGANSGGTYSIANREGMSFNVAPTSKNS